MTSVTALAAEARALAGRTWRLVEGTSLVAPRSGGDYVVHDPSSGEPLARVPDGGAEDVDAVVARAQASAGTWAALPVAQRAAGVRALADAVEQEAESLALLDAVDGGLPLALARRDIASAVAALRFFAGLGPMLRGATVPASEHLHYTERVPFGVVARIVAFNHPALFAIGKAAAPLVAGNAVVVKPSDTAPLSALLFGEIAARTLPQGVVSVVVGQGSAVPQALVAHPAVRRIGFIGSEPVGRAIQEGAARSAVKTVSLELGGKNALLAYPDCDPAEVARAAFEGMNFTWSGQSCGSTSRLVVHESLADDVVEQVVARARALRQGPALEPGIDQGPLITAQHRDRVHGHVERAVGDGAALVTGGGPPTGLTAGWFYEPTVLDEVTSTMPISREEVFGPVLSVLRWREEDEALALVDGTEHGLTASVFSRDITTALRAARAIDVGYVWVNGVSRHFPGLPYGGVKASGTGRDESFEELEGFTQLKSTTVFL